MIRTFGKHAPRVHPRAFVHDSAEVSGRVTLADKVSVWPMCSLRGDIEPIRVGEGTNIQDLTAVHTRNGDPVVIGKRVTVGHGVVIHGARIGDDCLIGMGAIVLEARVGARSLVAAGSLVLGGAKIPPDSLVMGSPAKVVRRLKPAERAVIAKGQKGYLRLARTHRRDSTPVFPR